MSLAEDPIELADLAGIVGVPFDRVVLGERPGGDEVGELLVDDFVRQFGRRCTKRRWSGVESQAGPRSEKSRRDLRLGASAGRRECHSGKDSHKQEGPANAGPHTVLAECGHGLLRFE